MLANHTFGTTVHKLKSTSTTVNSHFQELIATTSGLQYLRACQPEIRIAQSSIFQKNSSSVHGLFLERMCLLKASCSLASYNMHFQYMSLPICDVLHFFKMSACSPWKDVAAVANLREDNMYMHLYIRVYGHITEKFTKPTWSGRLNVHFLLPPPPPSLSLFLSFSLSLFFSPSLPLSLTLALFRSRLHPQKYHW